MLYNSIDNNTDPNANNPYLVGNTQNTVETDARTNNSVVALTPLQYSEALSLISGCDVWLKLENMQPTNSYKLRCVFEICIDFVYTQNKKHLVCSGLNNESFSIAYVGRRLGVDVTVFDQLPNDKLDDAYHIRKKIQTQDADIVDCGITLTDAATAAKNFALELENAVYINNDIINTKYQTNGMIIAEAKSQLGYCSVEPDCVMVSMCLNPCCFKTKKHSDKKSKDSNKNEKGNSGSTKNNSEIKQEIDSETNNEFAFLGGILTGMDCIGWNKVPVVCVDMLGQEHLLKLVNSTNIDPEKTIENTIKSHVVVPVSVSKQLAERTAIQFLEDHQMLIDSGSAAPMSLLYNDILNNIVQKKKDKKNVILVIVNGCCSANIKLITSHRELLTLSIPVIVKSGESTLMKLNSNTIDSKLNSIMTVHKTVDSLKEKKRSEKSEKIIRSFNSLFLHPGKKNKAMPRSYFGKNTLPTIGQKYTPRIGFNQPIVPRTKFLLDNKPTGPNIMKTGPTVPNNSNHGNSVLKNNHLEPNSQENNPALQNPPSKIASRSVSINHNPYSRPPPGPAAYSGLNSTNVGSNAKRIINRSSSASVLSNTFQKSSAQKTNNSGGIGKTTKKSNRNVVSNDNFGLNTSFEQKNWDGETIIQSSRNPVANSSNSKSGNRKRSNTTLNSELLNHNQFGIVSGNQNGLNQTDLQNYNLGFNLHSNNNFLNHIGNMTGLYQNNPSFVAGEPPIDINMRNAINKNVNSSVLMDSIYYSDPVFVNTGANCNNGTLFNEDINSIVSMDILNSVGSMASMYNPSENSNLNNNQILGNVQNGQYVLDSGSNYDGVIGNGTIQMGNIQQEKNGNGLISLNKNDQVQNLDYMSNLGYDNIQTNIGTGNQIGMSPDTYSFQGGVGNQINDMKSQSSGSLHLQNPQNFGQNNQNFQPQQNNSGVGIEYGMNLDGIDLSGFGNLSNLTNADLDKIVDDLMESGNISEENGNDGSVLSNTHI
ncbi:hypothetical protein BB558_002983 [Smittium angustum]|uniref:L-serine ammonia-lyase n=1 Tax=Smittium angustum TaxID=133377 RepID=A0A2U1J7J0_SMIAN|nr:hypothetical protein BB558_002983 [Smittium angustum]